MTKREPQVAMPMVLKGAALHAELNRENAAGLRQGLIFGVIVATLFWAFVAEVVWIFRS